MIGRTSMIGAEELLDVIERLDGDGGLDIADHGLLREAVNEIADFRVDVLTDLESKVREYVTDEGEEYGVEQIVDDITGSMPKASVYLILSENSHFRTAGSLEELAMRQSIAEYLVGVGEERLTELEDGEE